MKIRSDQRKGVVTVELGAREAMRLAYQLVKASIASGHVEDERPQPTEDESTEERES